MLFAVMYVESRFRTGVISPRGAYGLMQVTVDAVADSAEYCHFPVVSNMDEMLLAQTNIKYGSCYLKKLWTETGGDLDRTLIIYNGGYRSLTFYDRGGNVPNETANYILQVRRALNICSKLEK